jgi:ABC-2 type transport system ATP-binding protein
VASGTESIIRAERCSKWYGPVLGISDITWETSAGVVGLLGPNGAGKSTLMKLLTGLLAPSRGTLEVFGDVPWKSLETRSRIGYCPEHEQAYDELTALEFVRVMAELSGVERSRSRLAATDALERMGMTEAMNRQMGGFSKGMRQRTKLAQCLAHDPDLLVLDEPMTGVDPVARAEVAQLIRDLGEAGKTVVISSHVLYEIEAITEEIVLIYRGQVLAEGNVYEIRSLIDTRPHNIRIECSDPRRLASAVSIEDHIAHVHFERDACVVETTDPDRCYDLIAETAIESGIAVREMTSPDNNLGAVFEYLTGGSR